MDYYQAGFIALNIGDCYCFGLQVVRRLTMFSGMRSFGYRGADRETGESSEKRARYKMVTAFFEDKVLKWSLEDIMNENLFKDKVRISYVCYFRN